MHRSSDAARRRTARLVGAVAVALTTLLAVVGPSAAVPRAAEDDAGAEAGAVVLIGVTGLRWDDVHTLSTPALWELSRDAAVGAVAARSVDASACPADGWLAVSAGDRAADVETDSGACRTLRHPGPDGTVPGWGEYVAAAAEQPYGAEPGTFGAALRAAGVPVTGIGPGAAIALADPDGVPVGAQVRRPPTLPGLSAAVREALETSRLVVVDAGTVRDPGHATAARAPEPEPSPLQEAVEEESTAPLAPPEEPSPGGVDAIVEPTRAEQVRELDARVGAAVEAVRGDDVTVLLVSLADSGRPSLQLAAATGPAPRGGSYGEGLLTSGSTRQPGLVLATDVGATLGALLDVDQATLGAPIVPVSGPATATARVDVLTDLAAEARQVTRVSGAYLTRLVLAEAALFVAAGLLLARRGPLARLGLATRAPRGVLRALQVVALALASAPIASFLTGLVPWWRSGRTDGFWLALVAWMVVLTAAALLGPWRRAPLGPAAFVAGVTVTVLVVDAVLGSPLVIDSPMGAHRIMAARFYGMSNQAFALLAAGGPILAAALAQPLLDRGLRRRAVAAVVATGLVVVVVDGAPGLGSDFGGPPALILGFAVLTLVVAGRRVRWRTVALIGLVGAAVVMGFALLDWLRDPADRTHLGRFFQTVVDGGLMQVVGRKLEVHLRVLTMWRYVVLAVGGLLVTVLVLGGGWRRGRRGGEDGDGAGDGSDDGPLAGLQGAVPLLPATVAAVGLALAVGFLMNDSGIVVPATGMALAVPCLVAAAAQRRALELRAPEAAADRAPTGSTALSPEPAPR